MSLWNGNPNYAADTIAYNDPVTYNDAIYYNGSLQLSILPIANGAVWSQADSSSIPLTGWSGNANLYNGTSLYNADLLYDDPISYDGTLEINSLYTPDGTMWNIKSYEDIEDEMGYVILDEKGGSVNSEQTIIQTEEAPTPSLWNGNLGYLSGSLYNDAISYNADVVYDGTSNLNPNYTPSGTIWKEA